MISRIPAIIAVVTGVLSSHAEISFQPVVFSSQPAPGLNSNIVFSTLRDVSLANPGGIAFTATVSGPEINPTNQLGIWGGLPGALRLVARTGDPMPGSTTGELSNTSQSRTSM